MKKSILLLIVPLSLAIINAPPAWADNVADAGLPFLKLAPGARAVAMGEAFIAHADDATATWWNPAAMAFINHFELSLMRYNLLPHFHLSDLYYIFTSAVAPIPELQGNLGANLIFANYGQTEGRDENNMPTGTFHSYDLGFTLAYGLRLNRTIGIGLAGKFIYSHLAEQGQAAEKGNGIGTTAAADLGLLYRESMQLDDMIGISPSLALTLTNMGPAISYIDREQADPLPMTIRLGVSNTFSLELDEQVRMGLTANADFEKELVDRYDDGRARPFYEALFSSWSNNSSQNEWDGITRHFGGEIWSKIKADDILINLALQSGYYLDKIGNRHPSSYGFSLGLGYAPAEFLAQARFDFAWLTERSDHPLDGTRLYNLSLGFMPFELLNPSDRKPFTRPRPHSPVVGQQTQNTDDSLRDQSGVLRNAPNSSADSALASGTILVRKLKEMSIELIPEGTTPKYVVTDPDEALLIVHSDIYPLQFESTLGVKLVEPKGPSEYWLHLHPGTNWLTIMAHGYMNCVRRFYLDRKGYAEIRVKG